MQLINSKEYSSHVKFFYFVNFDIMKMLTIVTTTFIHYGHRLATIIKVLNKVAAIEW